MKLTRALLKTTLLWIFLIFPMLLYAQPDLLPNRERLVRTLRTDLLENHDPCFIEEGCVTGLGTREVLRFETLIDNIGDEDFYVGVPPARPELENSTWEWDQCHQHWHFESYAQYLLFNQAGEEIPIGFKTGFCLIDSRCLTGIPKYTCRNQGISAGCGDLYKYNTDCQWIDMTEVPEGIYTLVLRINWDRDPDANGRVESNYENNEVRVCFSLTRNSVGRHIVTKFDDNVCNCPDADQDGVCSVDDCDDFNPAIPNDQACPENNDSPLIDEEVNINEDIFVAYPWLSDFVNRDACTNEVINIYKIGVYTFTHIITRSSSKLYFGDGVLYCEDQPGFDCLEAYRLQEDLLIASWECESLTPNEEVAIIDEENNTDSGSNPSEENEPNNEDNASNSSNPSEENEPNNEDNTSNSGTSTEDNASSGSTTNTSTGSSLFEKFAWLSTIVNPENCAGEKVNIYRSGSFEFVHLLIGDGSKLYFENGTLYCEDDFAFSCLNTYGLGDDLIIDSWKCGDAIISEPPANSGSSNTSIETNEVFVTYPWLLSFFLPTTCIKVYQNGPHNFIHLQESNESYGRLYNQAGLLYCTDAANFDCRNIYELSIDNLIQTWNCQDALLPSGNGQSINTFSKLLPNFSNQEKYSLLDFQLFPNPARNAVYLNFAKRTLDSDSEINIYNYAGQSVYREFTGGANQSIYIDLQNMPNGFYMVELTGNGKRQMKKLVISK